jgi:hypothetical protein
MALLTDLGERLPCSVGANLAKPPHPFDIRWLEHREHLIAARIDDG